MKESFSTRDELSRSNPKYITEPKEQTACFFCGKSRSQVPVSVWQWLRGIQRKFRAVAQIPVHTAELANQRWLLTAHPLHLQFLFLLESQALHILSFSWSWTQNISIAVNSCAEWGDTKDGSDCALAVLVLSVCSISQLASGCSGASQQWNEDKSSSHQNFDY